MTSEHLEDVLSNRSVVDRATGVLMGRYQLSADHALALLVSWSERDRVAIEDTAAAVLREISGAGPEAVMADSGGQRFAEDDDLSASMAALWMLPLKGLSLEALLTEVAASAVRVVPGADGAGLTLLEATQHDVMVVTDPFVGAVDSIQYGIGQGPCLTAVATQRTVMSGSLGGDARWPRFGSRVARAGIHSSLSFPLLTPSGVVGSINLYARAKHAFDDRAAELGELFSVPAAVAVENAHTLALAQRVAVKMQAAQESRAVVDQAAGILMSRSGESEGQAVARMRLLSQHGQGKLSVVAQGIVDQAVRRARRRLGDPTADQ